MDNSITVVFDKERETKNAVRFAEVVEDDATPKIGTLYVKKAALSEIGNPDRLTVTVEG